MCVSGFRCLTLRAYAGRMHRWWRQLSPVSCQAMNTSRHAVYVSAILVVWLATASEASPEERAQLFKREVRKQFVADGWRSVRESPSQLVLQKPMTGVSGAIVYALTAEPGGAHPIWRWTFTFQAMSERQTRHHAQAAVLTRQASGKTKTIPLSTNRANQRYIDAKLRAANAAMPATYKR